MMLLSVEFSEFSLYETFTVTPITLYEFSLFKEICTPYALSPHALLIIPNNPNIFSRTTKNGLQSYFFLKFNNTVKNYFLTKYNKTE